jgi:hypothetical protein
MLRAGACAVLFCISGCAADAQRRLLASNFDVASARTIGTGIASGQLVGIDWNSDGANDVAVISSNKLLVYTNGNSGTMWVATTIETLTAGSVFVHIAAANMVRHRSSNGNQNVTYFWQQLKVFAHSRLCRQFED